MIRTLLVWLLTAAFALLCASAFAANYEDWTKPFDTDSNTKLLLHFDDGLAATTANDSSGNGVNGTLDAGLAGQADHYVVSGQAGFGNALKIVYDGANKKIDLPTSSHLASYLDDLTIECWIKPYEPNSYWTIIQNYTGGNYTWNFSYVAGKMRMGFNWYSSGAWQGVQDNVTDWEAGASAPWQHAAITWQKRSDTGGMDVIKFWKNGVKVFEQDTTLLGIPNPVEGPAGVGGRWLDGYRDYDFLGQMDELRMSNVLRYGVPVGNISAQVTLEDFNGNLAVTPVKLEVKQGTTTIASQMATLTSNPGSYTFTKLEPGTYDVYASAGRFLRQKVSNVVVQIEQTASAVFSLKNGDVNGNNTIDANDVGVIIPNIDQVGQ